MQIFKISYHCNRLCVTLTLSGVYINRRIVVRRTTIIIHNHTVGDITTGRKPACLGRVIFNSSSRMLKPDKLVKAQGRSRFSTCSRKPACINLYYKIGKERDQPGYEYKPEIGTL